MPVIQEELEVGKPRKNFEQLRETNEHLEKRRNTLRNTKESGRKPKNNQGTNKKTCEKHTNGKRQIKE